MFREDREIITEFKTPDGSKWTADISWRREISRLRKANAWSIHTDWSAIERALASGKPYVIDAICAIERPYSNMHVTGWWGHNCAAYPGDLRAKYVKGRVLIDASRLMPVGSRPTPFKVA